MMWIIHPVFIFTLCMFLFNVLAVPANNSSTEDRVCDVPHPLLYGIICFLVFLVVFLLILLFKIVILMQSGFRRDTIHIASDTGESTALRQNNTLSVSLPSGDGGDNSSSTSSGTPEGSLADLSQRYASLQDRSKTSDYINVAESASPARGDFHNKKMDIDYVNVKESQRKKFDRKGQASCDDGTKSVSSDASEESAVNYSKVVFTKTNR
ncbi:uncharacterized protein LOC130103580 isoform X2 [Rhinichthys klamathensis goyatoka]|uniref:uncharacterized protein LOC130103580 isoform X2 n=1 Tax=Rhinichthys klamathensis goyatoka TaxID=3034132 RepID=UPI0024B586AA|nr:uncharacterized protein LOC130103580 isoform X2 [Rhinichthys klamathensis goyatoka]